MSTNWFLLLILCVLMAFNESQAFTLYRATKPNHHSGSDSRNKSENVDLDETDGDSFDRLRNVLGSLNPAIGLMHRRYYREN